MSAADKGAPTPELTVTLTRAELIGLTGDNYVTSWKEPPPGGPVDYALCTLHACAQDLHVLSRALDTDVDQDALGMTLLRLAYKMEAVESLVARQLQQAELAAIAESEAAE